MKVIEGTVQWGIIGCGDVCEVKSGPAFNKVKNSKLVAVMRRDEEKAKDFAQRHYVPKFYSDVEQLINDPDINAVYIATPPAFHEEYAIKAMKAGKPVYIEKPVSLNSQSVGNMIKASQHFNVAAVVAHYRRCLPLFKKVKAMIDEGVIGNVQLVLLKFLQPEANNIIVNTENNWRITPAISGGGLFYDLSPHQLDILCWLFGEPIYVTGNSINQKKKYNAPDVTTLEAMFQGDIYMQGIWTFNMPGNIAEDQCRIVGDKGALTFSFFRNPVLELTTGKENEPRRFEFQIPQHIQQPMIEQVVHYLKGECPNPCSLEEALISMKMIDSAA